MSNYFKVLNKSLTFIFVACLLLVLIFVYIYDFSELASFHPYQFICAFSIFYLLHFYTKENISDFTYYDLLYVIGSGIFSLIIFNIFHFLAILSVYFSLYAVFRFFLMRFLKNADYLLAAVFLIDTLLILIMYILGK